MLTNEDIKKLFAERIPIFDGAMGTYLQTFGLKAGDYAGYEGLNEMLSISKPDAISKVHEDYLAAGADFVETNTFGANAAVLAEYGITARVRELNLASAKLAKAAAQKYSTPARPRYVAASIGPTNKALFVTGGLSFDDMRDLYLEQISALIEGGADIVLLETAHDILNLKAGLAATRLAFKKAGRDLPVIVSATMDARNKMLSGHDAESFYAAVEHFPLAAIGFNCSTGPEGMALRLERLAARAQFPVFAMPNAGLPDENGHYTTTPAVFASTVAGFAKKGLLNAAGGCCGTSPAHIKALAESVKGIKPRIPGSAPWVVSGVEALFYDEIEPPVMVGERNNSIGSKKFRDMVAAGDWDGAVALAKAQAAAGAHVLDLCLANPERNELADVKILAPKLTHAVRLPLMTDTTSIDVMEEVLKVSPGKALLNSVNFEFGTDKPRAAAELVKTYGAKLVFGCIDEDKKNGLPLEAGRKVAIARRAYAFLTEDCGLRAEDIIFDTLVFPVGVGGEHAKTAHETIKAIETIKKEFPGVKTVLGVSNVSFGLPPASREVLNSVFLHHAVEAGLDLAIVNIEKLKRYAAIPADERALAEDVIYARRPDAAQLFAAKYRDVKKIPGSQAAPAGTPPAERLRLAVLNGSKAGIEETVAVLLVEKGPLEIINGPIMAAMAEVGRQFSAGDLIVTEVLQSAEAARAAVNALEPALKAQKAPKRGKLLLATVKGDVHDIGKNLVGIMFESNGFEVEDLGVKVAPEDIVAAAVKGKPDLIGLSGLLVRSCTEMAVAARELAAAGIKAPLLVGGAALTPKFTASGIAPLYGGPVFYAADAMEGLNYALQLSAGGSPAAVISTPTEATVSEPARAAGPLKAYHPDEVRLPASFERHFVGDQLLEELFDNMDEGLFTLRFLKLNHAQPTKAEDALKLIRGLKKEIIRDGLIKPRGVYRFFGANGEGNVLNLYGADGARCASFDFPRRPVGETLCLSDLAAPEGGKRDSVALFVVTCGAGVPELAQNERKAGNYLRSYLVEALALTLAEAFADVLHYRIRKDWGIAEAKPAKPLLRSKYSGKRYSFGYGACPDLANQKILFDLLAPGPDAGIKLTDGFMMDPEASVSAIVFHNPKAVYFSIV